MKASNSNALERLRDDEVTRTESKQNAAVKLSVNSPSVWW